MIVTFPNSPFQLHQQFEPAGDQPEAIAKLVEGVEDGLAYQTLLGVTGSGKTYTMANVIARQGRPALIIAPNKTLAAQLYSEMREFFPENAVEYFVSYYDYYQPEAYVPSRDLFIEKDSSINEHIEQMRLSATKSLLERKDTIIVATVSCIYGIGDPVDYHGMILHLREREKLSQRDIIARLTAMQYERNEFEFARGTFRVRGDVIDVFPAEHSETAIRISLVRRRGRDAVGVRPAHRAMCTSACRASPSIPPAITSRRARPRCARSRRSSSSCASASISSSRRTSWSRRSASSSAPASTWKC